MRPSYREDRILWPHSAALLAIAAACALASGCSLIPHYERPAVAVPARFDEQRIMGTPTPDRVPSGEASLTPDESRFVAAFAPDREAERIVATALARSPDMHTLAARVAEARAHRDAQQATLFPRIGATLQRDKAQLDDPRADAMLGRDFKSATLDFRYDLDFFGRLSSLSDAAAHDYMASQAARKEARGALIAEVLGAYVDERAASEVASKLRFADDAAVALVGNAGKQFAVGTLSADDLQARRNQATRVHLARTSADLQHASALRNLQSLAGYDVALPAVAFERIGRADPQTTALADLPSSVLLERPDVIGAEERLRAANADIGAARAAFFPSIQLSSSLGHVSPDLDRLFSAGTGGWTFLPQLNLPLFDGGARRADLDLAHARKDAAVATYEATVQRAFREVANALDARDELAGRVERLDEVCQAERTQLEKAFARHGKGLEDPAGVLARTVDTAQVQIDCLTAHRDQALNRVSVFRAFYGVTLPSPALASSGPT